ncbi:hypothetical protein MPSEU_000108100 [Mayamaea pseudoterrestris]|nr:hypothetical protein MPSEU_000108100 [Mayamaea pseudoterrestris]
MPSTSVTAPGATGKRVAHEDVYEPTAQPAVTKTTTAVVHEPERRHHFGIRTIILVILCFLLPPLAVGLEEGFGHQLFLNIILLILGWIPAIVHALFLISADDDDESLYTNIDGHQLDQSCVKIGDSSIPYHHDLSDSPRDHELALAAAIATYQWAANFVVPHNLCPWAERSVQTKHAMQIVVLRDNGTLESRLEKVAAQFQANLKAGKTDANTAIVFCVVLPPDSNHWTSDFAFFYDWYLNMEDDWFDHADEDSSHVGNVVTLAPFHPQWQFATDAAASNDDSSQNDSFAIEKQSPYPTISMVSTKVIERAGEAATRQIFETNQETLASKTMHEWNEIYEQAVFGNVRE